MKYIFSLLSISILISCAGAKSNIDSKTAKMNTPERVLRHVVLFKFKDEATTRNIQDVEEAFSALPSKIPQIRDYEWGTNNSPEGLDKGYTHCFFVTFHSEKDREVYLPHPAHKAFVDILSPHLDDVHVIDYWTK